MNDRRLTIFVIGGYGTFGSRIIRMMEDDPRLTLVAAGRSLAKATAFCQSRAGAAARLVPAAFDRAEDFPADIARHAPDVIVDASGPFQHYGEDGYRILRGALSAGVHYLDLADASAFVAGVSAFDAEAKAAGVFVLAGASSFPVLTAAAVRRLAEGFDRVSSITAGIAPSPFAGVGLNVVRAIAGYTGKPVTLRRAGVDAIAYAITEHARYTIAPPGWTPLRDTLFSLVDAPDLRALPALWPDVENVWMGGGPRPEWLHRALIGLAWLVRWKLIPSLLPFAALMHWACNHVTWGEPRGGMFVEVTGITTTGKPARRSWHLIAEGQDGPFIPAMAVVAIVRRMLDGRTPSPGARASVRELELEDYAPLFDARDIHVGVREDDQAGASLYRRLLGAAYDRLPEPLRRMHDGVAVAEGRATVERGRGLLAAWAANAVGFPETTSDTPVEVRFKVDRAGETWIRNFGGRRFSSVQTEGRGRWARLLVERFGPFAFAMAVVGDVHGLRLVLRGWSVFGAPLPMFLCPRADASETAVDGAFRFDVRIGHLLKGTIVRYRGELRPVVAEAAADANL